MLPQAGKVERPIPIEAGRAGRKVSQDQVNRVLGDFGEAFQTIAEPEVAPPFTRANYIAAIRHGGKSVSHGVRDFGPKVDFGSSVRPEQERAERSVNLGHEAAQLLGPAGRASCSRRQSSS
jgi:hypothetical protein